MVAPLGVIPGSVGKNMTDPLGNGLPSNETVPETCNRPSERLHPAKAASNDNPSVTTILFNMTFRLLQNGSPPRLLATGLPKFHVLANPTNRSRLQRFAG